MDLNIAVEDLYEIISMKSRELSVMKKFMKIDIDRINKELINLKAENKKLKSRISLLEDKKEDNDLYIKYDYDEIKNRKKRLHRELKNMFKLFCNKF